MAGVRTVASAYAGCVTVRDATTTPSRPDADSSRDSTPASTTPPSSSTARASSPSSRSSAAPMPAPTSAGDFWPWSVAMPAAGR